MLKSLILLAAALAFSTSVQAQTTCQTIGQQIYCSNGLQGNSVGNNTYWNNGQTQQRIGNFDYFSAPVAPAPVYAPPPVFQPLQPIQPYRR
jgi:hypothetical protein